MRKVLKGIATLHPVTEKRAKTLQLAQLARLKAWFDGEITRSNYPELAKGVTILGADLEVRVRQWLSACLRVAHSDRPGRPGGAVLSMMARR